MERLVCACPAACLRSRRCFSPLLAGRRPQQCSPARGGAMLGAWGRAASTLRSRPSAVVLVAGIVGEAPATWDPVDAATARARDRAPGAALDLPTDGAAGPDLQYVSTNGFYKIPDRATDVRHAIRRDRSRRDARLPRQGERREKLATTGCRTVVMTRDAEGMPPKHGFDHAEPPEPVARRQAGSRGRRSRRRVGSLVIYEIGQAEVPFTAAATNERQGSRSWRSPARRPSPTRRCSRLADNRRSHYDLIRATRRRPGRTTIDTRATRLRQGPLQGPPLLRTRAPERVLLALLRALDGGQRAGDSRGSHRRAPAKTR